MNRFHISQHVICGELEKVKETDVHDFLSYFDSVKSKFSPRDIFNLDEAGVF